MKIGLDGLLLSEEAETVGMERPPAVFFLSPRADDLTEREQAADQRPVEIDAASARR